MTTEIQKITSRSRTANQASPMIMWLDRAAMPQRRSSVRQPDPEACGNSSRFGPPMPVHDSPLEIAENKWFRSALRHGLFRAHPSADRRHVLAYRYSGGRWSHFPQHAAILLDDDRFVFRIDTGRNLDSSWETTKLRRVLRILSSAGRPATGVLIRLKADLETPDMPQLLEDVLQNPTPGSIVEVEVSMESMLRFASTYKPFDAFAPYLRRTPQMEPSSQTSQSDAPVRLVPQLVSRVRALFRFAPSSA